MTSPPLAAPERRRTPPETDAERHVEVDTPTLISVSALAWATADVFHEIVGHAGAAVVL